MTEKKTTRYNAFLRHCEAIAEAIHNNKAIESKQVDCHDSAFAESRNDRKENHSL